MGKKGTKMPLLEGVLFLFRAKMRKSNRILEKRVKKERKCLFAKGVLFLFRAKMQKNNRISGK